MEAVIADLHVHSRHARGTSSDLTISTLESAARRKGVQVLGTGDFTHPLWIKELSAALSEDGSGILRTRTGFRFVLQTELSFVFTSGGHGRRVHLLVFAPSFAVVERITSYLLTLGRVDYDGRPTFGISCRDFAAAMESIDARFEIIPAHVWTPWFGLFGSKSGFDSVEEAFLDKAYLIHSLETGLSSDPAMNWRLSALDRFGLVSFSDLHSAWPWRMSREATLFASLDAYDDLLSALRTGTGLLGTVEVDPLYGKYHYDGHRACRVRLSPEETRKLQGICPVCRKPLTVGVEYRVEELADRPVGYVRPRAPLVHTLLPLSEVIAAVLSCGVATKKVASAYEGLVSGSDEYTVLMGMEEKELRSRSNAEIARAVLADRAGRIRVSPGYDGVYGVPLLSSRLSDF